MTLEEIKVELAKLKESTAWAQMQIGILDATITGMQKQPEQPKLKRWKPCYGQHYYSAWSCGTNEYEWMRDSHLLDVRIWESFNCFQTQDEAAKEELRTRARRKLEWLARELNGRFEDVLLCWSIAFDYEKFIVISTGGGAWQTLNEIRFALKADAEYALSQMTAEELEALR